MSAALLLPACSRSPTSPTTQQMAAATQVLQTAQSCLTTSTVFAMATGKTAPVDHAVDHAVGSTNAGQFGSLNDDDTDEI